MTSVFSTPWALSAAAAASPAGPAPTMSTSGSPLLSKGMPASIEHRLHAGGAIEALAAAEHGAGAALQARQGARGQRRGERVPDFAHADALAMTQHLGIGGIRCGARCILPRARGGFGKVGHPDGRDAALVPCIEYTRHDERADMLGDAQRSRQAGRADSGDRE